MKKGRLPLDGPGERASLVFRLFIGAILVMAAIWVREWPFVVFAAVWIAAAVLAFLWRRSRPVTILPPVQEDDGTHPPGTSTR